MNWIEASRDFLLWLCPEQEPHQFQPQLYQIHLFLLRARWAWLVALLTFRFLPDLHVLMQFRRYADHAFHDRCGLRWNIRLGRHFPLFVHKDESMPRQPFLVVPEIREEEHPEPLVIGVGSLQDRPKAMAIIGRCLLWWPQVEHNLARLLAVLLKTETPAAVAVYLTLRRSSARTEAITAAASLTLSDEDKELCAALLKSVQAAEAERNSLAHGAFGISRSIQDGILWLSAQDHVLYLLNAFHDYDDSSKPTRGKELRKRLFVYRERDLLMIEEQIKAASASTNLFIDYLQDARSPPDYSVSRKDELYVQLCNQAPIREALLALRAGARQSTPPAWT